MAVSTTIQYATLDELRLDPLNPRLGRTNVSPDLSQEAILELMKDWTLEELAVSYIEGGGFWPQEALLVIKEKIYGQKHLVVLEGNRRLAALKLLQNAINGDPLNSIWSELASRNIPKNLFKKIPYLEVDKREDVESFLGFRHVTGIKEWHPAEKAEFISRLVDRGSSYKEVSDRIGSKPQTVRQNYISFRLLLQLDDSVEDVPRAKIEERFSVMYLSLRTKGVQNYLHIDIQAPPSKAKAPVPKVHLRALANFAKWLFGTEEIPALVRDSRQIDNFGRILESKEALSYLERTERPNFETAYVLAGGSEAEVERLLNSSADDIELALSKVHLHLKSSSIRKSVRRVASAGSHLLTLFPSIRKEIEDSREK